MTIQGVMGPIESASLGVTLPHEHLLFSLLPYWTPEANPEIADRPVTQHLLARLRATPFACRDNLESRNPSEVVHELRLFKEAGGATCVELTNQVMGRDIASLRWVAERTGVQIIVGTGFYVHAYHPSRLDTSDASEIAEELVRELEEGIDGTQVRAGVLGEVGAQTHPMHPKEVLVLQATAIAQKVTGAPIFVHPAPASPESAFEIVDVLDAAGADLTRVAVSHLDVRFRDDLRLHRDLAGRGVWLSLDTFGRELYWRKTGRQHPSDEERVRLTLALLDAGLGDQLLLSHDICFRHELSIHGGHGYSHLLVDIASRLRAAGISDEDMRRLFVSNPRRVLVGVD